VCHACGSGRTASRVRTTDLLICTVAATEHLQILTTDADFLRYAKHPPIHLSGAKL